MPISTAQFTSANNTLRTKTTADDAFVADYITLLKYHLEVLAKDKANDGCDIQKLLEANLKQALEKPAETKALWVNALKANVVKQEPK